VKITQETSLPAIIIIPSRQNGNPTAILKGEGGNVDGIGLRMFRQSARAGDVTAAVGTKGLDQTHRLTEMPAGCWLQNLSGPIRIARSKRTGHCAKVARRRAYFEQLDCANCPAAPGKVAIGQAPVPDIIAPQIDQTLAGFRRWRRQASAAISRRRAISLSARTSGDKQNQYQGGKTDTHGRYPTALWLEKI
jgi:hypothetical protein